LHRIIDREFRKAGIVISFPQRDIHPDTGGPLEVRVVSEFGKRVLSFDSKTTTQ